MFVRGQYDCSLRSLHVGDLELDRYPRVVFWDVSIGSSERIFCVFNLGSDIGFGLDRTTAKMEA